VTPDQLAALHAGCFTLPRPWSATEFRDLLMSRGAFLLERPGAFLLGRVIADEAELLTLAVGPDMRRRGTGAALTREFAVRAGEMGAESAFLEVAENNAAARQLYVRCGWTEAGRRRRYYAADLDAIIMRLEINPAQQGG
jgi:ribosomal-protein-alanine N-acetyltransferase